MTGLGLVWLGGGPVDRGWTCTGVQCRGDKGDIRVTNLFHGLNRAKHKIALVVKDNPDIFDRLLNVLQRK